MPGKPKTIDEYLAALNEEQRAALTKLRETIRAVAPQAEECISYQLAAFRLNGMLVAFGATPKHCAFYLMSGSTVEDHQEARVRMEVTVNFWRGGPNRPPNNHWRVGRATGA